MNYTDRMAQMYLEELGKVQAHLNSVMTSRPIDCKVDARYLAEWQKVAAHLDITVLSVRSAVELGMLNPAMVEGIGKMLEGLLVVVGGLFNGHVTDLANCTECAIYAQCPLRARARAAFEEMIEQKDPQDLA